MESHNVTRAKEIINKYPEVFESLLVFEKTKKIPKLYYKKHVDITIDENILRDFKTHCKKNNINTSRFVEQKMQEEIRKAQ